jgi:hypothetical protein
MILLDRLEECHHLLFTPRIAAEGRRLATSFLDGPDEIAELVGRAPRDTGQVAFAGDALGDRAAERVSGADDVADRFAGDGTGSFRLPNGLKQRT